MISKSMGPLFRVDRKHGVPRRSHTLVYGRTDHKFKVYTTSQKQRLTPQIKRG
jgi:hypothetical protein